jgi:hypothetical protein
MKDSLKNIKKLIAEGRLEDALSLLNEVDVPSYQKNRIIMQSARFRIFKKHEINNDLTHDQLEVEEHQLLNNILCIVDSIHKSGEIERKREERNYSRNTNNPKLSLIENTTFTGLVIAGIGLALIVISHVGHSRLIEPTFWIGVVMLIISLLTSLFARGVIAPRIISSFQKTELQSKDFKLLFTDLSRLLRHTHDFSALHIHSIESTLDFIKNSNPKIAKNLSSLSKDLKDYSTMSGIFDDTMNILEDIEYSIMISDQIDLKKYSVDLEKNIMRIKEITQDPNEVSAAYSNA